MKKLLILALILFGILLAATAYAADCGGTTPCNCSNNLIASRVLNASDNLTNCAGTILILNTDGVTLDCNGTTVSATGSNYGIQLSSSHSTVRNCTITNGTRLIYLHSGINNTVDNNVIYGSRDDGIAVYSHNHTLTNNAIHDNQAGITIYQKNRILIQDNNISSNNKTGVYVDNACFLEETKILLADGSYKNIEDIQVGDLVKSYDEDTGELRTGKVKKTFYHEKTQGYLIINNLLKLTKNHPMYVNNNWASAGEIKLGDLLWDKDGNYIEVTSIQEIDETVPTYNLEVSGYHNYFAENILTHNKCPRVFTHNGEDYEFDLLINVAQLGVDSDKVFSYPLKHMKEPMILIEYDPDEVNYIDHLELKITDKADKSWWQFWLKDKSYVLKPISCIGSSCDVSKIADRDYDYLLLDEDFQEYYIEFEEFPVLEQGYERTIEIISSGYQLMLRHADYSSYPSYVMEFLNEYFITHPHNSFTDIINNTLSGNGLGGTSLGDKCGIFLKGEDNATIINNTINTNKIGIGIDGTSAIQTADINITGNSIYQNTEDGINIGNFTVVANLLVWHNNIYSNTNYEVNSSYHAIELSYNNEGNYWGRTTCPLFIAGTDSNAANVTDTYPYAAANSWDVGGSPSLCPPTAGFGTNPVDAYNSSSQTVTFELNCSDDTSVDVLQLWGDWTGTWHANQTNSTPVNHTIWAVTVNNIPDGTWTWGAYCNDSAGNGDWTDTNRTFTVDTAIPGVTITAPAAGTGYNASFVVTATVTDSPSTVTYRWENTSTNGSWASMSNTTATSWNATFNVASVSEGSYTFRVNATDASANSNSTETVTGVIIDTTAPNITAFSCSDITAGASQSCSCSASDNSESFGGSVSTSVTSADTSTAGTKSVTCTATDTAGNTNESTTSYTVSAAATTTGGGGTASTYVLTVDVDEGPQTYTMRTTDIIRIKLDGDLHSFKVTAIYDDYITVRVKSNDEYYDVKINETVNVDVDKDGTYDLSITLKEIISSRRVKVTLERISEVVPEFIEAEEELVEEEIISEEVPEEEAPPAEEVKITKKVNLVWLWILIIAVVVVVCAYYFLFRKKKRGRKKKHSLFSVDF